MSAYYYRPPTIKRVRIADEHIWSIQVTWADGEQDIVSLNPILEKRGSLRRRFERSPDKFWDVSVVDQGRALSWFNASIDISAQAIEDLVFEQQKKQDLAALWDNGTAVDTGPVHGSSLLLETGAYLLLEDGTSTLLLEH